MVTAHQHQRRVTEQWGAELRPGRCVWWAATAYPKKCGAVWGWLSPEAVATRTPHYKRVDYESTCIDCRNQAHAAQRVSIG
jgi:hypothetical protein